MRSLSLDKRKGQVGNLAPAILALVFAGVVLVFGIVMSQELRDTRSGTELVTILTNETLLVSGASISGEIVESDYCGYTGWNATLLINSTVGSPTGSNETLFEGIDYIINANGSVANITYLEYPVLISGHTYNYGGEACDAANSTVVGLGTFADFWEIIILAIVITVVIGLLLVIFGGKPRR